MSCELCRFVDRRAYDVTYMSWTRDGVPVLTVKYACSECGWWQVAEQVWNAT